jgi:hypothetical protein
MISGRRQSASARTQHTLSGHPSALSLPRIRNLSFGGHTGNKDLGPPLVEDGAILGMLDELVQKNGSETA